MPNENAPVGDFTGRTAVVTGANSGIGLAAARGFAAAGAHVVLVGRDAGRLDAALAEVRAAATGPEPVARRADFAELAQVRELAAWLREAYPAIDLLANNAGGVFPKRITTVDGHEQTMQVNHLAPFLLTNLLTDRLEGRRVVNTASDAHRGGRLDPDDLDSTRGRYSAMTVYGSTKQANILFAAEAARRWPGIASYSFHPGVVRTRFGRDSVVMTAFYRIAPGLLTPEQGADTLLWLAGTPGDQLTDGGYYAKRRLREPIRAAADPARAARLWETSAAAVGLG
jgi:NAD(P)-dependent dehydrogenase (short-subunit alcohol dehydrogenase family)